MLSVESSPVNHYIIWKVFVRSATKQLELNCLGLCIYSWERWRLCLWISLNLVWHLSVLTLLILHFTSGNSARLFAAWWDGSLLLLLPFYLLWVLHKRSRIPLVGEIGYDTGVVSLQLTWSLDGLPLLAPEHALPFWEEVAVAVHVAQGTLLISQTFSSTAVFRSKFGLCTYLLLLLH